MNGYNESVLELPGFVNMFADVPFAEGFHAFAVATPDMSGWYMHQLLAPTQIEPGLFAHPITFKIALPSWMVS